MKKALIFLCALLFCTTVTVASDTQVNGIWYDFNASAKTASVTFRGSDMSSSGYTGSVIIPRSITYGGQTYSVTSIGEYAFNGCSSLTSITIPNSVTSIGDGAFIGCSSLTSITIPNSVTSIGDEAFEGCSGLTSITIPNSVTSIRTRAFKYCFGLTSITIPNSVTNLGDEVFSGCPNLTSIVVESSNTKFDSRNKCNAIIRTASNTLICGCKNTIIPNTVTRIGNSAFDYCSDLTSVTIPNSVTSIGSYAFRDCSDLNEVHITDLAAWCGISFEGGSANPLSYAHHLYLNGEEVTNLVIPNSVTSIRYYAFYGCSGLTSITIPNSVTSIGESAFYGCSNLTSITIPNSMTSIGSNAFRRCENLRTVYNASNLNIVRGAETNGCVAYYADNVYSAVSVSIHSSSAQQGIVSSVMDGVIIPNDIVLFQGSQITIKAIPNTGYQFNSWSDGNTDSVRTITISQALTLTANFGPKMCKLTIVSNIELAAFISGAGTYAYGTEVSCVYYLQPNYRFVKWGDGSTANPYKFNIYDDMTLDIFFEDASAPQEKDSLSISISSSSIQSGTVSATVGGKVSPNSTKLSRGTQVIITATPATGFQFNSWSDGNTENPRVVTLTQDTSLIANFGAKMCTLVLIPNDEDAAILSGAGTYEYGTAVVCSADVMSEYKFLKWSNGKTSNPYRFIIRDDMTLYAFFVEDDAPSVPEQVVVTPTDNNANLQWPQVDNAMSYSMTISKGGETVCTLTFNGLGQLVNIDFAMAPARSATSENVTSSYGFNFTVTGLAPGTTYGYLIEAKDEKGDVLSTEEGTFTTTGTATSLPESADDAPHNVRKLLREGQLLIQRDGKTYNMQGAEVR